MSGIANRFNNKFGARLSSSSQTSLGLDGLDKFATKEEVQVELQKAVEELEVSAQKMLETETPTVVLEMEYDMNIQKVERLESQLRSLDPKTNNDNSSGEEAGDVRNTLHSPVNFSFATAGFDIDTQPDLYFLELYGYDANIFKNIVMHGNMRMKLPDNDRWIPIYIIVSDYYERVLYVIDDSHTRPSTKTMQSKKRRKNLFAKPMHVIRLEGSMLKVHTDSTEFSICTKVPLNINKFGDNLHYIDSALSELIDFSFGSDSHELSNNWMLALQDLMLGGKVQDRVRIVHSLSLCIKSATLPNYSSSELLTSIFFAGEEQARTGSIKAVKGEVNWIQTFEFDDIPSDMVEMTFEIVAKKNYKKHSVIASVSLSVSYLRQLGAENPYGKWLDVVDNSGAEVGRLLLVPTFSFSRVLPYDNYEKLIERLDLLVSPDNADAYEQTKALVDSLNKSEVQTKASVGVSLLRYYMAQQNHIQFLCNIAKVEIQKSESLKTLFRGNSVFTKTMDFFMNFVGNKYLKDTVGSIIQEILAGKWTLEVDPNAVADKKLNVEENIEKLYELTRIICDGIFDSMDNCPLEIRRVLSFVKQSVIEQFSHARDEIEDFDTQVLQSVSSFLFLRFFSAAMMSPSLQPFGLCTEIPSSSAKRTLTLVSKIVQKLSNLVEFHFSESYLVPFNDLLKGDDYYTKMCTFLEKASTVDKEEERSLDTFIEVDVARTLAQIHRIFSDIKIANADNPIINGIVDTLLHDQSRAQGRRRLRSFSPSPDTDSPPTSPPPPSEAPPARLGRPQSMISSYASTPLKMNHNIETKPPSEANSPKGSRKDKQLKKFQTSSFSNRGSIYKKQSKNKLLRNGSLEQNIESLTPPPDPENNDEPELTFKEQIKEEPKVEPKPEPKVPDVPPEPKSEGAVFYEKQRRQEFMEKDETELRNLLKSLSLMAPPGPPKRLADKDAVVDEILKLLEV